MSTQNLRQKGRERSKDKIIENTEEKVERDESKQRNQLKGKLWRERRPPYAQLDLNLSFTVHFFGRLPNSPHHPHHDSPPLWAVHLGPSEVRTLPSQFYLFSIPQTRAGPTRQGRRTGFFFLHCRASTRHCRSTTGISMRKKANYGRNSLEARKQQNKTNTTKQPKHQTTAPPPGKFAKLGETR